MYIDIKNFISNSSFVNKNITLNSESSLQHMKYYANFKASFLGDEIRSTLHGFLKQFIVFDSTALSKNES